MNEFDKFARGSKIFRNPTPFYRFLIALFGLSKLPRQQSRSQLESGLIRAGLTRRAFDLGTLREIAGSFGRNPRFIIETLHGQRVVVPSTRADLLHEICDKARANVRHWGVSNVEDLAAATDTPSAIVRQLLPFVSASKWLDESAGWFWIPDVPRNSLLTPIRKILAVAPQIEIGELRVGVGRPHRRKGFAPPRRVLLELCRQLSWCEVKESIVEATEPQKANEVLSESEMIMFNVMREHGPVLRRDEFERLCLATGMNRHSFWVFLSYCPIITRYATSVYGLRGADVPAGLVERLIPKRSGKSTVLVDYGWTKDRKLRVLYRLSAGILSNGIVTVPAALKAFYREVFIDQRRQLTGWNSGRKRTDCLGARTIFSKAWRVTRRLPINRLRLDPTSCRCRDRRRRSS